MCGWAGLACRPILDLHLSPPPETDQASSLIFLFDEARDPPQRFAVATERGADGDLAPVILEGTPWFTNAPRSPQVSLAAYPSSLKALELPAGLVPNPRGPRLCELADPILVFDGDVQDDQVVRWSPRDSLLPEERSLLIGDAPDAPCRQADLCLKVHTEVLELPTVGNVDVLLPLDSERALVGANGSEWFVVDRTSVRAATEWQGMPAVSAILTPEGVLWAGGRQGEVRRGPAGGPFVDVPLPRPDLGVWAMGFQDSPRRILALGNYRADPGTPPPEPPPRIGLYEWSDAGWIERFYSEVPLSSPGSSQIRWLGEGEAWVSYGDRKILEYREGRVQQRPALEVEALVEPRVEALLYHPRWGLMIGSGEGSLYYRDPEVGEYRAAPDVVFLSAIQVIGAIGDNLFVGGIGGRLLQHHPLGAPCRENISSGSDYGEAAAVGGALLMGGGNNEVSRMNLVTWVIPD